MKKAAVAITGFECDKEPIHLIQAVQEYGAFLQLREGDLTVHALSANAPKFFGLTQAAKDFLGRGVETLFENSLLTHMKRVLASGVLDRAERHVFSSSMGERALDVHLFRMGDRFLGVEIDDLAEDGGQGRAYDFDEAFRGLLSTANATAPEDVLRVAKNACGILRRLTGMDRVMLYRFRAPDMHGEVVTEDRVASARSFLNHNYPATDIPEPARALYLKNKVRYIRDALSVDSPIVQRDAGTQLDLTHARLRAVSQVHTRYMTNMGHRTSLSVAIEVDGKLWGLLACHSKDVTLVPCAVRSKCETLAGFLSSWLPRSERLEEQNERIAFDDAMRDLFRRLRTRSDPVEELFRASSQVFSLFACTGIALSGKKSTDIVGQTPARSDVERISEVVREHVPAPREDKLPVPYVTNSHTVLDGELRGPAASFASGVLAVRVGDLQDSVLLLFRSEVIRTVEWGSDSSKVPGSQGYGKEVNPRVSYETWLEDIRHTSLPWKPHHVQGIVHLYELAFATLARTRSLIEEAARNFRAPGLPRS